jgi:hypothetical protein
MTQPTGDIHEYVREKLDGYPHDLLSRADADLVERHCLECASCQEALADARKVLMALRSLPAVEASEELIGRTEQRLEQARPTRPSPNWWRGFRSLSLAQKAWLGAAAAALIIGALHIYYATLSPSPFDLRVLGQAEMLPDVESSLRIIVFNRDAGAAVPGVPVEVSLKGKEPQQFLTLAQFETDANGTGQPRWRLPDWEDGEYELKVVARTPGGTEAITRPIKLRRALQVMLSTDRPVYQPGQVIRMRSLSLRRPDLRPVAGEKVAFTVSDPKGNKIFLRREKTSRFGIAAADCPLAEEGMEGACRVDCQVGDAKSSILVEVKKYVLPKFKVQVALDRPFYQPGELIRGTIQADYFFGKPVGGARVTIARDGMEKEARPISARTDASGKAIFQLPVPDGLLDKDGKEKDAEIMLSVKVVDGAGQQQSVAVSRVVTDRPLRVEVIPEGGSLVRGQANTIYLLATYADGRPARAEVSVTSSPRLEFNERTREHMAVDVVERTTTDDLGVASLEVTPPHDRIELEVRASDSAGRTVTREVTLKCAWDDNDFLLRTDRGVYDGGQTMHLTSVGAGAGPVFLDFLKDGQLVRTESISMSGGKGEHRFDLPPELFGTIQLCACRMGAFGSLLRKSRVVYVRQARQLAVSCGLDGKDYRPGATAKVSLRLVDDKGKPTPGAISLAGVDEAVFSVLDHRPGPEESYFVVDERLLQPVRAVYPWSPRVAIPAPAAKRERLEQAIFARTAASGAGTSRDALRQQLLPFLENNERIFDVLERPDWEELVGDGWLAPDVLALLRQQNNPHSMQPSTYPDHLRQTKARKERGLGLVNICWVVFFIILGTGILVYSVILINRQQAFGCVGLFSVVACLLVFVVFSAPVMKIREASVRTQAINDIKQLGLAIEDFRDVYKKYPPSALRADPSGKGPATARQPLRVRHWFPETLLWRPELITDDEGRASLDVPLADSITTWRLTASAVSADGRLGASQTPLRVFQPFFVDLNLPVALTRGDEVAVPVVVYNYLQAPQTVTLTLAEALWFDLKDVTTKRLELQAGETRSLSFRLRARKVGDHTLQVTAQAGGIADAVKRLVEVIPDGRAIEKVVNGSLQHPADIDLSIPPGLIEGSARATLRLYPSSFSQLVEGLDGIFQRPYGCFEQTSSTTYPNVLALDYLRRANKSAPALESKARQYIHLGYQRLLGFEVAGGGFDWFGRAPANRILTAYGLMEFEDMARVHDVDPALIDRTRKWLLAQRRPDGTWDPESHDMASGPGQGGSDLARLRATAYIAWAVFASGKETAERQATVDYLLQQRPAALADPYTLSLVAYALLALQPDGTAAAAFLDRLDALKRSSEGSKFVWWEDKAGGRTMFYGAGRAGKVETTALATLAFLAGKHDPATIRAALTWLSAQKDGHGTWHSTQATVLALKALLAGTGKALGPDRERRFQVVVDGKTVDELVIPADHADLVKQIDLSPHLGEGPHQLRLSEKTGTAASYQVALRYHIPGEEKKAEHLSIQVVYQRTELKTNETVEVTTKVVNSGTRTAPMVMVELPLPGGFAPDVDSLQQIVKSQAVAKVQHDARKVVFYLTELKASQPLALTFQLRALVAGRVTAAPAVVYEYYDPDHQASSPAVHLAVVARP